MPIIIIYVLAGIAAVVLYILAVQSRKTYSCPNCGEKVATEFLEANRCGVCGSKLKEDTNG